MKRSYFISMICLGFIIFGMGLSAQVVYVQQTLDKSTRDAYVDDSYYWHGIDTIIPHQPTYDRNARELIFMEDTTLYPDTVRMRIIEK